MIVVKVGGSLFDHPNLGPGLSQYLATLQPQPVLLVAGGGGFADAIRELDRVHELGEEVSHALAIRAMVVSAHFLKQLLNPLPLNQRIEILDPLGFTAEDQARPNSLPHSWSVTSDSIAARVAVVAGAEQLILLKSVALPEGSWESASRSGLVDPEFAEIVRNHNLAATVVNFRGYLDRVFK